MAGLIPLFISEEEENSFDRERVFKDRSDPLDCYDDLELVQRFRFSRSAILTITKLIESSTPLIDPMLHIHMYKYARS